MRKLMKLFPAVVLFLCCLPANGQTKDEPIRVNVFSVDVKANCFSATTLLQIELHNPNPKILDGEYKFTLNDGQVITGFALDINGHMRPGVIVDKQKGRVAYENTIRRRIDPGLLEATTGNSYRVRVYPMPANGIRKINITISEILPVAENALHYNLPIELPYKTKEFNAKVSVKCSGQEPFSKFGLLKEEEFIPDGDSFTLLHTERNVDQLQNLSFSIALPKRNLDICSEKRNDSTFFMLHAKPAVNKIILPNINTITVFWDVSSSAAKNDREKEMKFLQAFCADKKVSAVTIVTFSNKIHETKNFSIENGEWSNLRQFLVAQPNDGGTQLGVIDCNNYTSDAFILFSDGLTNYGSSELKYSTKSLFCISSSGESNQTLLKKIASRSRGRYVNLKTSEVNDAIKLLNQAQSNLISINTKGQVVIPEHLPLQFDGWITLCGVVVGSDEFVLRFGDQGQTTAEIPVNPGNKNCGQEFEKLFSLQQYQSLLKEEMDLTEYCKHYGFVSETTSLIVLDNLSDYIAYGIEPPAELQEEYNKQLYIVRQKQEDAIKQQATAKINNLRSALELYNQRIGWWDKNEKTLSVDDIAKQEEKLKQAAIARQQTKTNEKASSQNANSQNLKNQTLDLLETKSGSMMEVVVTTSLGVKRRPREIGYSTTTVKSESITTAGYTNLGAALSGRVAGLTVYNSNQAVNSTPKIVIRGFRSITGNNEPLIVIDNNPVPYEFLSLIDPNEIESITVLKGGQGSILYGSDGANGVILITRKKGKERYWPATDPAVTTTNITDTAMRSTAPTQLVHKPGKADWVQTLNRTAEDIHRLYLGLKDSLGKEPSFYFNAADAMMLLGKKDEALRVLSNLTELDNENHQLLRAMGYMLESWGFYKEAVEVYSKVLTIKEEEPQSYRDLALAYERNGEPQKAVEILYSCLTKNWFQYESRYHGLRGIILNEMNAIISRNPGLDLSGINESVIKALPVDLRIVIDWNKDETDVDLHVIDPAGEECYYSHKLTNAGGRLSEDFTQGYGPEEFQVKQAKAGTYTIRVKYFGDRYQKLQIPSTIKLTIYKNFGKPDQTTSTQTFVMDKQSGMIEISEVKF